MKKHNHIIQKLKEKFVIIKSKEVKKYFLILIFIGILLALFYFFYIKYYDRFYGPHYYEHYTRNVVLIHYLKNLNFEKFLYFYGTNIGDKIIIFRSIPFMILFGSSQLVFIYSNFFLNYGLFLWLFYALTKIMKPKKAFMFSLFMLSNYFFLELLASPYVDLTYFLVCSLFFVYLNLFIKDYKKHNYVLMFLIFSLFLTKNTSYILIPFFSIVIMPYLYFRYQKNIKVVLRYLLIVFIGLLLYFGIGLASSPSVFMHEISSSFGYYKNSSVNVSIGDLMSKISQNFSLTAHFFLLKFSLFGSKSMNFLHIIFNIILYLSVFYFLLRGKHKYWTNFFLLSEFFLFFFYNIAAYDTDPRFFLPFFIIYLYLIWKFVSELLYKLNLKYHTKLLFIIIFVFFSFNFTQLFNNTEIHTGSIGIGKTTEFVHEHILSQLPERTRIYVSQKIGEESAYYEGFSFIDYYNDFYYLSHIDSRFKYRIVANVSNADYILCSLCDKFNDGRLKLLGSYKVESQNLSLYLFEIKS